MEKLRDIGLVADCDGHVYPLCVLRAVELCEEAEALMAEAQQILDHLRQHDWLRGLPVRPVG